MILLCKKIKNFIVAWLSHTRNGSQKSSQSLINLRHSICSQCDRFDKENGQCLECGCSISNRKILLNKLAWFDQKCPLNKW